MISTWTSRGDRRVTLGQPQGYTLIELLVVVSIVSIVLASLGVSLVSLFRVDQQVRDSAAYTIIAPRLSISLRTDAHLAKSARVESEPAPGALLLDLPEERVVEYRSEGGRLMRLLKQGDVLLHREVFILPGVEDFRWTVEEDEAPFVRLEYVRQLGMIADAPDATRQEHVEAALGLHRSIVAPAE